MVRGRVIIVEWTLETSQHQTSNVPSAKPRIFATTVMPKVRGSVLSSRVAVLDFVAVALAGIEVAVGDDEVDVDDDDEVDVTVGNVNVRDPDASLQNCCARSSSVISSEGQFDRIHPTTSLGKPGLIVITKGQITIFLDRIND